MIGDNIYTTIMLLQCSVMSSFASSVPAHKSRPRNSSESQQDHEIAIQLEYETAGVWMTNNVAKMMFVSGETAEPSPETTTLIEEITRQQVIEIVSATRITSIRSTDDKPAHSKHSSGNSPWCPIRLHRRSYLLDPP